MSLGYDLPLRRAGAARSDAGEGRSLPARARAMARRVPATPELLALMALSALLNLWNLSVNGWANTYYSGAMRSMSTSWHDFLFASLDKTGLMTLDKPPLALWVQALSVRVFGLHPLSVLVPEALMGVVASALLYDLVRRRFGRLAGFVAGFALATTPVIVAVSRHNNPDELLVLCSVAALWCFVRSLERGAPKWLVLSAVCVGLGFETKMLVAFMVVPGMAVAWLWAAPVPLAARLRRGIVASACGLVVALAWPILVTLTPAADRPWISGTSDNSIWSLIFGYNGVGRVAGQTGGPGGAAGPGGGNAMFGGATGPFRLLQVGPGRPGRLAARRRRRGGHRPARPHPPAPQRCPHRLAAGHRRRAGHHGGRVQLRQRDLPSLLRVIPGPMGRRARRRGRGFEPARPQPGPRPRPRPATTTAKATATGTAAATAARRPGILPRILGPALLIGGAGTELVVLGGLNGQLAWGKVAVLAAIVVAVALALAVPGRVRSALVVAGIGALLLAPATWATETLGHATSSTFPAGGPASADGGPGGGFGARAGGGLNGFAPRAFAGPGGGGPGAAGPGAGAPHALARVVRALAPGRGTARAGSVASGWPRRLWRRRGGWPRRLRWRLQRRAGRDCLRQGARRRHDRGAEPELGRQRDPQLRRTGGRPGWVLRPGEHRQRELAGSGGRLRAPALDSRRCHLAGGPARRHPLGQHDGVCRRGQGVHRGEPQHERVVGGLVGFPRVGARIAVRFGHLHEHAV